jgi:DUF1009 family protein
MNKLGIIAGGGNLPKKVIQVCRQINRPHFIVAFEGMTDADTVAGSPHEFRGLGEIEATLNKLKEEGCTEVTFVGRIERPSFSNLKMDKRAASLMAKAALRGFGDNAVLSLILEEIEKDGFKVVGAQDLLTDILAPAGVLGSCQPDDIALRDIKRGQEILRQMAPADVGQSVIVQQEMVLGIEAIEGTDALIERCVASKREGPAAILVKMRKTNQETRVDLPTIGLETIKKLHQAGFRGLAIEAQGTIILNRTELIDYANQHGIFVVGVE